MRLAIFRGEKKSTVKPLTPSFITSRTGGVAEPTTTQPGERLNERPREDEGVSQVDMRRGYLQQVQVLVVADQADEVHPVGIESGSELFQHHGAEG